MYDSKVRFTVGDIILRTFTVAWRIQRANLPDRHNPSYLAISELGKASGKVIQVGPIFRLDFQTFPSCGGGDFLVAGGISFLELGKVSGKARETPLIHMCTPTPVLSEQHDSGMTKLLHICGRDPVAID